MLPLSLAKSTAFKNKLAPATGKKGERTRESLRKNGRIIETKKTKQKRQTQTERGVTERTGNRRKKPRDSDKQTRLTEKDLWSLE